MKIKIWKRIRSKSMTHTRVAGILLLIFILLLIVFLILILLLILILSGLVPFARRLVSVVTCSRHSGRASRRPIGSDSPNI
jgi:hypothetical protein